MIEWNKGKGEEIEKSWRMREIMIMVTMMVILKMNRRK